MTRCSNEHERTLKALDTRTNEQHAAIRATLFYRLSGLLQTRAEYHCLSIHLFPLITVSQCHRHVSISRSHGQPARLCRSRYFIIAIPPNEAFPLRQQVSASQQWKKSRKSTCASRIDARARLRACAPLRHCFHGAAQSRRHLPCLLHVFMHASIPSQSDEEQPRSRCLVPLILSSRIAVRPVLFYNK